MQILGVNAAATDPTQTSSTGSAATTPASTNPTDKLANESTFLQLLVAQIKNQDPLNPTDSMQFVGQLVQFSQLEQLIGIKSGLDTLEKPPTTPIPSAPLNEPDGTTKSI
jgi:flagellar basal-body rod modification protein FlgD